MPLAGNQHHIRAIGAIYCSTNGGSSIVFDQHSTRFRYATQDICNDFLRVLPARVVISKNHSVGKLFSTSTH